jgi:hypothetical protein
MIEMASSITRKITTMKATGENDQKVANCRKQEDHKDDAHNEEQAQAGKQTMHNNKELFLMDWPPFLAAIQLLALISIRPSILYKHSLNDKVTSISLHFKRLLDSGNFSTGGEDSLFLSSSKA